MGEGQNINIEFVSANPTGPLHIGHGRGAAVGASLSSLLTKTGFNVINEYYINDAGNQMKNLAESLYLRYMKLLGEVKNFTLYIAKLVKAHRDFINSTK